MDNESKLKAVVDANRRAALVSLGLMTTFLCSSALIGLMAVRANKKEFDSPLESVSAFSLLFLALAAAFYGAHRGGDALRASFALTHVRNHLKASISESPHFLLLRSFDKRDVYVGEVPWADDNGGIGTSPINFAARLDGAVTALGTLVAIGGRLGMEDSDHSVLFIECDSSQWRNDLDLLARGSKAILFLPESTSGVLEELHFLIENRLLRKTIWVMPPATGPIRFILDNPRATRWSELQDSYRGQGVQMATFKREGSLFILGSDLTILFEKSLGASWDSELIGRALKDTLDHMAQRGRLTFSPLRDVYKTLAFSRNPWDEFSDVSEIPGYDPYYAPLY